MSGLAQLPVPRAAMRPASSDPENGGPEVQEMSESRAPRSPRLPVAKIGPPPGPLIGAGATRAGFILMDSSLKPIGYNAEAAQILTYPELPGDNARLDSILAQKIRTILLRSETPGRPVFADQFKSGRRQYGCRSFPLGSHVRGGLQHSTIGLLLERSFSEALALEAIAQEFKLTERECEAVEYLFKGLTSKEIAQRMGISSNTVKAFLRLVMIKMGVSTRSGIVGKIAASRSSNAK
jgi:DNA-binding CsgD family transcriptional regulator